MTKTAPNALPVSMLRDFLKEDAPQREAGVARVVASVLLLGWLATAVQAPFLSPAIALPGLGLLSVYTAYYVVMARILRRGMWHAVIPWVNVFVEVSFPIPFLILQAQQKGAEYALSSSIHMGWGPLLALSAIRMRRSLCVAAGILAGASYLAMYLGFMQPRLGPDPMVTYTMVGVSMRIFHLVVAGIVAAALAHQLVRKAQFALSQVRARDLMGKYFLHEELGRGGMAEVYRATYSPEGGFEKEVAIKRVLPELSGDPAFIEMFRQEAQMVARLNHSNVVQVFDIGRFDGRYLLAMEFVDGAPLSRLIQGREPLPPAAIAFVGHQVAAALHYIHARRGVDGQPLGIVHHDVNPPNILVSRLGEAKLSDFGVARAALRTPHDPDVIRGKINYMSPEQILGGMPDGRVDLYTLGLTLHEALTGKPVHTLRESEAKVNLMVRMVDQPVDPPSTLRPGIPPELDAIVMKLLEKEAGNRFQTGAEVCAALEALPPGAAPFPAGQRELALAVATWVSTGRPRGVDAAPTALTDGKTLLADNPVTVEPDVTANAPDNGQTIVERQRKNAPPTHD